MRELGFNCEPSTEIGYVSLWNRSCHHMKFPWPTALANTLLGGGLLLTDSQQVAASR